MLAERIASRIVSLRGRRVIIDADLAALYGVETKRLNEQVRRNLGRFPEDFVFQLTKQEVADLKSQFATSSWGGKRKPPLERKVGTHDRAIGEILQAIRQLATPVAAPKRRIGFLQTPRCASRWRGSAHDPLNKGSGVRA